MSDDTNTTETPAKLQGDLWGDRARDWAEVMEGWDGWGIPLYRHVLERVPVASGTRLLDVGCGAGRFCRIAADRGAKVAGIDASGPLVEIARERVPNADFRVGDMEQLPWADESFDVVTGFNSFFIAGDIVNALREARRVSRAGAIVAMTVFGRPDQCQSTPVFASLAEFAPSQPSDDEQADGGRARRSTRRECSRRSRRRRGSRQKRRPTSTLRSITRTSRRWCAATAPRRRSCERPAQPVMKRCGRHSARRCAH